MVLARIELTPDFGVQDHVQTVKDENNLIEDMNGPCETGTDIMFCV